MLPGCCSCRIGVSSRKRRGADSGARAAARLIALRAEARRGIAVAALRLLAATHQAAVHECLCDNFNTAGAMAALTLTLTLTLALTLTLTLALARYGLIASLAFSALFASTSILAGAAVDRPYPKP